MQRKQKEGGPQLKRPPSDLSKDYAIIRESVLALSIDLFVVVNSMRHTLTGNFSILKILN
jgi:hypothetical protein